MIATLLLATTIWQPYIGAPQPTGSNSGKWSGDTVAATAEHSRAWATNEKITGDIVSFDLSVGPLKAEKLSALLYCHVKNSPDGYTVLNSISYWPPGSPQANKTKKFKMTLDRHSEPPCRLVLWWTAGLWQGGVRMLQAGLVAVSEAVQAGTVAAAAKVTAPVASAVEQTTWSSLPYRIWMDNNYFPPIPALEVCYLSGSATYPNSRIYPPVFCQDQRPFVTTFEWCSALLGINAGAGVDPLVVNKIKSFCR